MTQHVLNHTGGEPINVMNVGKSSDGALSFLYTKGHILGKNPINIMNVGKSSIGALSFIHNKELTLERNYKCNECGKHFSQSTTYIHTRELTQERNPLNECEKVFCYPSSFHQHK